MMGIAALSGQVHLMRTDDRGSALQTVIVAPATLLMIALIVTFGVLAQAHQKIEHAANDPHGPPRSRERRSPPPPTHKPQHATT